MEYVARKSNLVVPEGFVELDREEMTYVDGGKTTYYSGWDAVWACLGAAIGVSIMKITTTLGSTVINNLRNMGTKTLLQQGSSTLLSAVGKCFGVLSWVRLALYGLAITAGIIAIANTGTCRIGLVILFGVNICPVW